MDKIMAFLHQHLDRLYRAWERTVQLPTKQYKYFSVNWTMVSLFVLVLVLFIALTAGITAWRG